MTRPNKLLRVWKRFTRRTTRGGVPVQMPAGTPRLIQQNGYEIAHVPPQRLNFGNAAAAHALPRHHHASRRSIRPSSSRRNKTHKKKHSHH